MRKVDNITAFFGADDVFSNWHVAPFTYHDVRFNCVEQFKMFSKARLFGDEEIAAKILAFPHPASQKALGRTVRDFKDSVWLAKRESIVFVGCREKFAQNPPLLKILLESAPTVLVEASPTDRTWGVGLNDRDPRITDPTKWRGRNLLGITLMRVRDQLSST
ncbi:N-glycosidase YbiA [Pararobbsia alpina]|uniref:N-glycosidase YbiA n=2 Tax=Pararobbsia alpina TaxID=621374 RepID=A0A6S7D3K7_9BURK|nr:N-glycosidase YbiA [Pararobbsia alpina]